MRKTCAGLMLLAMLALSCGPGGAGMLPPSPEPTLASPLSVLAGPTASPDPLPGLDLLKEAYPDIGFAVRKDTETGDWIVQVTAGDRITDLFYADGRFLARAELGHKDHFRRLIYPMPDRPADPAGFSPEDIKRLATAGSAETRKRAAISGTAFFDALYDSSSLARVEEHVVHIVFLGKRFRTHERLVKKIQAVEARILSLARNLPQVAEFVRTIDTVDGFYWRQIRDTGARSFHSMGIALDILPKKAGSKIIYWNWEKDRSGDKWMLIPLSKRWSPPPEVIRAFRAEGFIWGGNWMVWDNMHFEYRPELLGGRTGSLRD